MSRPKKRRVIVRFAARDGADAKALLQAVEDVLRPSDLTIEFAEQPRASDERAGQRDSEFGNEMVEAEAKGRVGDHLEDKDQDVRAQREKRGGNPDQPNPESPAEIARRRFTIRETLGIIRNAGWRVTMHVCKEHAVDLVKAFFSGG